MIADRGRNILDHYCPLKRRIARLHGFHKVIWDQRCALQLREHERLRQSSIKVILGANDLAML